jgi:hypothetical protein
MFFKQGDMLNTGGLKRKPQRRRKTKGGVSAPFRRFMKKQYYVRTQ